LMPGSPRAAAAASRSVPESMAVVAQAPVRIRTPEELLPEVGISSIPPRNHCFGLTVALLSLPPDESYCVAWFDGAVAGGRAAGAGAAAAGAGCAPAVADGPFIRSGPSRLTFAATLPGGPTGGATALPTVIFSVSGLPALSFGAVAVGGT